MERLSIQEAIPLKRMSWISNKSILTPTSGFLASGYTHTLNPYVASCSTTTYSAMELMAPGRGALIS